MRGVLRQAASTSSSSSISVPGGHGGRQPVSLGHARPATQQVAAPYYAGHATYAMYATYAMPDRLVDGGNVLALLMSTCS